MSDLFAAMTADALAVVGASAFYTPSGRSSSVIKVVVSENIESVGENGQVVHLGTVIDIDRADVDQPGNGDTIEISDSDSPNDGTTYTVHEIVEQDQYLSRVVVSG